MDPLKNETSAVVENNPNPQPATVTQTQTTTPATEPAEKGAESLVSTEPSKTVETKPAESTPAAKTEPEFNLKPEDYGNFGLDEKTEPIKTELSSQLKDFAIKHKIGKEDMNSFVKGYMDFAKKEVAAQQKEYDEMRAGWEKENEKAYGENVNSVYQSVNNFLNGSEKGKAFSKFLTDNKIDKNNVIVAFLNEVSKDYKEGNLVNSNVSGIVKKSDYELLYPEDSKK